MNVSWMSNPQYLAQVGHFFGASSLIMMAGLFTNSLKTIFIVLTIGIIMAAVKEFWFDIQFEKDIFSNSLMDFSFYLLGAAAGLVVVLCAFLMK